LDLVCGRKNVRLGINGNLATDPPFLSWLGTGTGSIFWFLWWGFGCLIRDLYSTSSGLIHTPKRCDHFHNSILKPGISWQAIWGTYWKLCDSVSLN